MKRFYNSSLVSHEKSLKKDMQILLNDQKKTSVSNGDEMSQSIIALDNNPTAYLKSQNENVLVIEPYYGDDIHDDKLLQLIPFLIALHDVIDKRSLLHRRFTFSNSGNASG
jgi:TFIIF-interacting CTD phosphatase-like protein